MAIEVAKVELKTVQDASGLEELIKAGKFSADEVIGVIGKTEGNGGVNDFTRILADQAFRRVLLKHGTRSEAEIHNVPMVWSGGCDGVITPHATIFARNAKTGAADKSRLVIGTALSAELLPEDIGRLPMVQKVADAVKAAMKDAGITDPKDVHYVQTKTPLLTIESVRDAESRHQTLACEVHDSMGRLQRHHRARHCGRTRRIVDAEGRGDLQESRSVFVGGVVFVGRGTDPGPDRAARQQGRRRRPLPDRPFGDARRARYRRHL